MNYENYPIKYSEYNLILPNPTADAILEEFNRQYIYHTFCDFPSEIEERIVIDVIDEFYNNDEDDALCQNDPLLIKCANRLDPDKTIDRLKLNMLLLNRCDGLKVVFADVDNSVYGGRFLITKDAYTMAGLIGAYLMGCGVDDPETSACKIADELAFDPSQIRAIVLESNSEDLEEIDESAFEFDDDDDYCFEDLDDDIDAVEIAKHLKEQRAEKELLETENESPPAYIELHDKDGMRKYDFDAFRKSTKGILSKPEQESFIKLAEEVFKKAGWLPHD